MTLCCFSSVNRIISHTTVSFKTHPAAFPNHSVCINNVSHAVCLLDYDILFAPQSLDKIQSFRSNVSADEIGASGSIRDPPQTTACLDPRAGDHFEKVGMTNGEEA